MRTFPGSLPSQSPRSPSLPAGTFSEPNTASVTKEPKADPLDWPGRELLDGATTSRVLTAVWSGDPLVIIPACPGAGKTRTIAHLSAALAHRVELRIAVAAQTREQALDLAERLGQISDRVILLRSSSDVKSARPVPEGVEPMSGTMARWPDTTGGGIMVATTSKWIFSDTRYFGADIMIIDEAWQCTYADIGALGAFARQLVCVGDPGQISPVVTGSTTKWEGSVAGPHLPAPDALMAKYRDLATVHRMDTSWRLGPTTASLVSRHFYPDMPFTSSRPDETVLDHRGDTVPEIAVSTVAADNGPADGKVMRALADRAEELLGYSYHRVGVQRRLTETDIAVVVPHVAQAGAVQALLSQHPGILVGTANSLQGLERPAVVALHPQTGYRSVESFATDAGRTCVSLSRHRTHLTLVADPRTVDLLDDAARDGDEQAKGARDVLAEILGYPAV